MSMGLSVVIPAYNYAHCLVTAVRSVLSEPGDDFEVLVINDGSSDNTDEVMTALLAEGDARLRYISQPNQGLSAVRNRGIKEGLFEWLVFLDADDEMCPGALEAYRRCASEHPRARLLIGGHYSCKGDRKTAIAPIEVSASHRDNLANYLEKKLSISNGACAMHKSLFANVGYDPNLRHTEDVPVFSHILANFDVASFATPVAAIHKHDDSMRHDVDAALKVGPALEAHIFDDNGLPEWAQSLRKAYRTRRLLSLLKICDRADRAREVRGLYLQLLRTAPVEALKPRYLRRFVRSLFAS